MRTIITRHAAVRYGMALLAVAAALAIMKVSGRGPSLGGVLLFAVMYSAWFGGLGPGLLSTGLITALGISVIVRMAANGSPAVAAASIWLGLFTAAGLLVSALVEALHRARRRAETHAEEVQRHQATLRHSEARFQAILENSPAVVTLKDTAGRYLMVNRRFTTLFGMPQAEVVGKTDFELFRPDVAEKLTTKDRLVLEARGPIEFEELVPHPDGPRTYLAVEFPLCASDGSITAICTKSTDITDRKRGEEYRFRLGRQAALRGDVSVALAGNEAGLAAMLESCARAAVRHLDLAEASLWTLGPAGDLVLEASAGAPADGVGAQSPLMAAHEIVAAIAHDRQPRSSNGLGQAQSITPPEAWVRDGIVAFAGYPLIVEDRLLGVLALCARHAFEADTLEALAGLAEVIAQGIERKRLELERIDLLARERAARAEAEAANHAKDRFLAVLSHELRTPLTPILASVTALLDEPGVPPEVRAALELTHWGIELESRLIDDLLDMTQVIRGRLPLQRKTTDAHFLIQRAVEICREEIAAGKITLVQDLAAAEHHVDADPARLEQVFWNLIKNAVKFSPEGGTLRILTRNEPVEPSSSGAGPAAAAQLVIEFSDTGIGIEPEVLPIIFDAFTQAEGGWVRRFGGLGIGLAISRSVMEALGGKISAASAGKNQGATFTLTLAATSPPAVVESASAPTIVPAAAPVSSPTPSPRMLKILLVEDDAPTLKVMKRLLGRALYVVTAANSYTAALGAVAAEDFDLIISDIGLPDGSGLELMRQIRDRYQARGIALSGYGMEEDIRKSREAGFVAHLTKPVDFQKLQVAIAQVLS